MCLTCRGRMVQFRRDKGVVMPETKIKPILTCSQCMSGYFLQIERRVTGVVIDEGEVIIQEPKNSRATIFFTCKRCGCIVPPERLKDFRITPQIIDQSMN